MARTPVTVNTGNADGLNVASNWTAGIADGHEILNPNQNVNVIVQNNNAAAKNITFQTPQTIGDEALAVEEQIVEIPASGIYVFTGFKKTIYNQSDGKIYIDYHAAVESDFNIYPYTTPLHL